MSTSVQGRVHFYIDALDATLQKCVDGSPTPVELFDWALRVHAIYRCLEWLEYGLRHSEATPVTAQISHGLILGHSMDVDVGEKPAPPPRFAWVREDGDLV